MLQTDLTVRMARSAADIAAAQRLRYDVFVTEMGGAGDGVDHINRLECDGFDTFASHLLLEDRARPFGDRVVGTYRLMTRAQAGQAGGFYSASEYDLSPLIDGGRQVLELGRSCLHPDYRGGPGLMLLWRGLANHVLGLRIDVLFGVASFPGTDSTEWAQPLSYLYHHHRAGPECAMRPLAGSAMPMNLMPADRIDRKTALAQMPPLIKAYLRLGAVISDAAFVDRAFNTIDVGLVVDVAAIDERQRERYSRALPA